MLGADVTPPEIRKVPLANDQRTKKTNPAPGKRMGVPSGLKKTREVKVRRSQGPRSEWHDQG
eukprot:9537184-Alexandrium_andersonii.AAC.1